MEYLELYTADHKKSGVTIARGEAIPEGLLPLVVGIWTVNHSGQILLTLRHAAKPSWPNMWENSGGAVRAGEDSLGAAVRELQEETGIVAAPEELLFLGTNTNPTEIIDCFLLHRHVPLEKIVLQEGETAAAKWVTPEELETMMAEGLIAPPIAEDWRLMHDQIINELNKQYNEKGRTRL